MVSEYNVNKKNSDDSSGIVKDNTSFVGEDKVSQDYESIVSPHESSNSNMFESHDNLTRKTNWPDWLIDERNQVFFGVVSLALSFMSGIGIITGIYYLWGLDQTVQKVKTAKWLNIFAIIIPIIGIILYTLFILSLVLIAETTPTTVT